jgi:alpha-L-fucosidase
MNYSICSLAVALAVTLTTAHAAPEAPFTSDWESLKQYQCPEWFRDAKFGIWSHWGPQSVLEGGDWYARNMYVQGHGAYREVLRRAFHEPPNDVVASAL